MASYYFSYNGVNLSNLARVRAVETTVLPPRENHAITIWERTGSIYNSYRYGERDIVVTFLIRATQQEYSNNTDIMESKLNTLRNVFKVTEPKPLYLGTNTRYILAVPEGDFKMTELRYDCYECEIQFVCHNPEYYSASVKANNNAMTTYDMRSGSNNSNTIEVYNGGNASAYPIINIGINDSTSFVQIENTTNGNKFLLGSYPKAGMPTVNPFTMKITDDMTEMWTATPPTINNNPCIDSDRGYYPAQAGFTSDGSGIRIGTPNTSGSWHGIGLSKEIRPNAITNFEVKAKLHLNSYGVGGDPTNPQYIDEGVEYGGEKTYFYKVVAPSVPIKKSPDMYGSIIGTYNKGDYVFPLDPDNPVTKGWVQVEGGGYCEVVGLKKYIEDTTSTSAAMNVVVKAEEVELMSLPSDNYNESLLLATIPYRTPLRVHRTSENGYYKLYIPYNGKVGYIAIGGVTPYSQAVEYPESDIIVTDDSKTGICEVYGYSDAGTKLFKLCLSDENEYQSFVTPTVYVGDNKVLDDTTVSSNSSSNNIDEYNVAYDALSDSTCDWNNFYGELGIRRMDNKWQAWIYKIEDGVPVKKLLLKEQEISGASYEKLRYIVVYMGTRDSNNMCGMAITDLQVAELHDDLVLTGCNISSFKPGDEIKVDCYNGKVYLNNKLYNNIDMNSQFIELVTGNNILKTTSDPSNKSQLPLVTVLFNERYL